MKTWRGTILAAGAAPHGREALLLEESLAKADISVACDRAMEGFEYIVGDGDGLTKEQKNLLGDKYVHIAEQDTNDLAKAYRFITEKITARPLEITVFGATGGRIDHELGNIFHLADFEKEDVHVEMVCEGGTLIGICGSRRIATYAGADVSVFAPESATKIKSRGLKWPLDDVNLDKLWSGTLNKATTDEIELESNKNIIVYISRKAEGNG